MQSLGHACIFCTSNPRGHTTFFVAYVLSGNSLSFWKLLLQYFQQLLKTFVRHTILCLPLQQFQYGTELCVAIFAIGVQPFFVILYNAIELQLLLFTFALSLCINNAPTKIIIGHNVW